MEYTDKQIEKLEKRFGKTKYKDLKRNLICYSNFTKFLNFVKTNKTFGKLVRNCLSKSPFAKKDEVVRIAILNKKINKKQRYGLTYVELAKEKKIINDKVENNEVVNFLIEDRVIGDGFDRAVLKEL